jgi:hypothetical protein
MAHPALNISTLAKLSPVSQSILIGTGFDINSFFEREKNRTFCWQSRLQALPSIEIGHFWTLAGKSSKMAHPALGISTLAKLRPVSQSVLNRTSYNSKQVSLFQKKQDDSLVGETSGPPKLRNGSLLDLGWKIL